MCRFVVCAFHYNASPTWLGCSTTRGQGSLSLAALSSSMFSSTVDGGEMGVSLDSAVNDRLWLFDIGDDVVVNAGESKSVLLVHREVSEMGRRCAGGAQV